MGIIRIILGVHFLGVTIILILSQIDVYEE